MATNENDINWDEFDIPANKTANSEPESRSKKIDLNFIRESVNKFNKQVAAINITPLLQVASLLVYYTQRDIEENVRLIFKHQPNETELKLLELKSLRINKPGIEVLWILNDAERNKMLRTFSLEEIRELSGKIVVTQQNLIQHMLQAYINDVAPALEAQNIDQLVATYSVSTWLKETKVKVPSEKDINNLVRRKEFVLPFEKITKNFSGRQKELMQLSDYVDWLPKTLMQQRANSIYRQAFSYHEKPPMLIWGIGGVGKSTLVSKFIVDHLKPGRKQKLPFIYFDFDRPGLSIAEPMLLGRHALQQLSIQFPESAEVFQFISEEISLVFGNKQTTSRSTDRHIFYQKFFEEFSSSPYYSSPILVVFDSFEELQYRASPSELDGFFTFLTDLLTYIPRLRPVFAGRSEIFNSTLTFSLVPLEAFDEPSALAYLESLGITDPVIRKKIKNKFGGNPLTLQLAADLVLKDKVLTTADFERQYGSDTSEIDDQLIQQQLVQRNLDHVHDLRVRKIAVPGILVRNITPLIIQWVLAEPCGLGSISEDEANDIFDMLVKESFLVMQTGTGISFRQDLRISLYDLITRSDKYDHIAVHNNAVRFYEHDPAPQGKAEYLYHRLKRGDDPLIIREIYNDEMRIYLENSLKEFSADANMEFASLLRIPVSEQVLRNASLVAWERYMCEQIKEALEIADESTMQNIVKQLQQREERSHDCDLGYYEAKVYERLGDFDRSEKIVGRGLTEARKDDHVKLLNLALLAARIQEYKGNYEKAYNISRSFWKSQGGMTIVSNDGENIFPFRHLKTALDALMTEIRTSRRADRTADFDMLESKVFHIFRRIVQGVNPPIERNGLTAAVKSFFPKPYCAYYTGDYPIDHFVKAICRYFYSAAEYEQNKITFFQSIRNKAELDQWLFKRYNVNLKDVCEPGTFEVNKLDVLKYTEINNGQPPVISGQKKRIVVCCDGIWNKSGFLDRGKPVKTNVEKISRFIAAKDPDGTPQVIMYDAGLGIKKKFWELLIGGSSASTIDKVIKDLYTFIALNYQPGDDIYLFGFSRGAYIARSIGGMIRNCGILKNEFINLVDEAYEIYRDRTNNTAPESMKVADFMERNSHPPKIKFIGVWETVGFLGVPILNLLSSKYRFHDVTLSRTIENAYHALGIDEKRYLFQPTLWKKASGPEYENQKLEQRWFAGVHSNIGGGYADEGLSDITLKWMMEKASETGLHFQEDAFSKLKPDPMGELRNSYTPIFYFWSPRKRTITLGDDTHQTIDESVLHRMRSCNYDPSNAKGLIKTEQVSQTVKTG